MNTVLQQLQIHASVLPSPLQAELLHYAIYPEQRAKESASPSISDAQRRARLAEALESARAPLMMWSCRKVNNFCGK